MMPILPFLARITQWLNCSSRPSRDERLIIVNDEETPQPVDRAPDKNSSDVRVVDEEVICNIVLKYSDERSDDISGIPIRWTNPSMTTDMQKIINRFLQSSSQVLDLAQLHTVSRKCSIVRKFDKEVVETNHWKSEEQWKEDLPLMIMRFYTKEVKTPFYLDICWEFGGLLPPVAGEKYAKTVHKAIARKMTHNWEPNQYISKLNLEAILSKHTVAMLINKDESLRNWPPNITPPIESESEVTKEMFIEDVWTDAIRLLALHVCTGLELICLYQMMIQGKKDLDLVKEPLTRRHCPCEDYLHDFDNLVSLQGKFFAHQFSNRDGLPEHVQVNDRSVVPIKKSPKALGRGGFGEVFEVSVEPGHHSFPCENKSNHFAMKVFHGFGQRPEQDFYRESSMLQTLSKLPHSHITPHLASWTQNGKFYMLFPLAECNLKTFLRNTPAQDLTKDQMLWLVSQLVGLADGVRNIHNLAPTGLVPTPLDRLREPVTGRSRTAFHHDLKPENILVFLTENGSQHTFKISDFGSAKVSQLLSGSGIGSNVSYKTPGQSPGDPQYGAPETETDNQSSRPYDIWSLGCIYLEILLWVFRSDLNQFYFDRQMNSQLDVGPQSPAFWYKAQDGCLKLKPAVTRRLKMLTKRCAGRGFFEELVKVIRQMLVIPPRGRIKAPDLHNALDAMRVSAELELNSDPDAYINEKNQHAAVAAPPSASHAMEDLSSNDEQEGEASSPSNLGPGTHNRTKSDGKLLTRSRISLKRNSVSDPKSLAPLETNGLTQDVRRPRSPSIAIYHTDAPDSVIDGLGELGGFSDYEDLPPLGAHVHEWGLEDFEINTQRPRSVRSRRSFSEGDVSAHSPAPFF